MIQRLEQEKAEDMAGKAGPIGVDDIDTDDEVRRPTQSASRSTLQLPAGDPKARLCDSLIIAGAYDVCDSA